ncbi:MAG: hypothetical protein EAZ58_09635 [Flavobacterium sp.]|nr:MAG: hypothetical protein EAZ58_09635 [Flavobacterium sp.]
MNLRAIFFFSQLNDIGRRVAKKRKEKNESSLKIVENYLSYEIVLVKDSHIKKISFIFEVTYPCTENKVEDNFE